MSIVNNITISGFKVYGESCDSAPTINTLIGTGSPVKIYSWQNTAAISDATGNYTVLLKNGSGYAGVANVDTLSVMINTATASDLVYINGYQASIGVGSGGSTAGTYVLNWRVWNPQCVNSSNVPTNTPSDDSNTTHMAYTVSSSGTLAGGYILDTIKLSGSFSSNQGLPAKLGSNNINIIIKDSTGATVKGQYNFNVVVTQSNTHITSMVATPSSGTTAVYSPAFDSDYCAFDNQAYSLIVAPGTTSVSLLPVLAAPGANPSASIAVSCASPISGGTPYYQVIQSGVSTGAIPVADDSIITLVVTAADGVTQQTYTVSVQANTGNNYLGSVTFNYNNASSLTAFETGASHWSNSHSPSDPTNAPSGSTTIGALNLQTYMDYKYLNCLPNVNYGITAAIFAADQNSTVSFNGGAPVVYGRNNFFIPYSKLVQGGITEIPVICTSPVGISRTYTFQIWVASNAAFNKAALTNIVFSSGATFASPFNTSNILTSNSLNFTGTTTNIPKYTVFVNSTQIGKQLNLILTYNDLGCRYSISNDNGLNWVPSDINAPAGDVTADNWTLGPQRTTQSATLSQILTPGTGSQTLVATHLTNGQYYGYCIQYIVPGDTLTNLSLFNSSNDLPIALSPAFNNTNLSYDAFIGTATSLANTVKLNVVFSAASCTYTVTPLGGNPTSPAALSNNTTTLISLGAPVQSYVLTINLYNSSSSLLCSYTVNLMNIDSSLLLSGLQVYNATYTPASGLTPASYAISGSVVNPTAPVTSPVFINTNLVYEYSTGLTLLYYAIKPTVSYPSSQNISISVNGGASVPVVSGSNFYMPSTAVDTVVITISDNLIPQNSNQYTLIMYNQSTDVTLKLANFMNIPNGDWSTPLPDGVTYTTPIGSSGTFNDSVNSSAVVTAFTATPNQTGTLMYVVQPSGFVPLAPGVPSANIPLTNTQNVVNAWSFANSHANYCNFKFTINKIISINSLLSSFVMTNANPFVFNSLQYVYNGITLQSGQTSFSFTATAQDSTVTSIVCTMNGLNVTGSVSNGVFTPTNPVAVVANVNNVLLVTVTAHAGNPYVTTYTFNITRPSTSLLSNIRVFNSLDNAKNAVGTNTTLITGEAAVNPTPFVPTFFTYSSEVSSDVTVAYVVLVKSTEASISMVNGTYQGNTTNAYGSGVVGQIWAVPVQLSSTTPNSLVFQLNPATISVTDLVSTNVYNLSIVRSVITTVAASISLVDFVSGAPIQLNNMSGAPVAFDPQVFTYTIPASMYAGHQITTSIIGANGVSNTYYLNGAIYYVPQTYVIDASHPITINVVSNSSLSAPSVYQISLL